MHVAPLLEPVLHRASVLDQLEEVLDLECRGHTAGVDTAHGLHTRLVRMGCVHHSPGLVGQTLRALDSVCWGNLVWPCVEPAAPEVG